MSGEIILQVFFQKGYINLLGLRNYFPEFMNFLSKIADY